MLGGGSSPALGKREEMPGPYTDIATIRGWCRDLTAAKVPNADITAAIVVGDQYVDLYMSKWPSLLVALPATPDFIRALGDAATCEALYRRSYSEEGEAEEDSDRKMWEKRRDDLLKGFISGAIRATTGPATQTLETNASRVNRYPVFGYGAWCERMLSTTMPDAETGYEIREDVP